MTLKWPVKILLVHPYAEFLQNESLYISADCGALLNKELHKRFEEDNPVLIGCPLLENPDRLYQKIKLIIETSTSKTINVFSMEVPCCHAIHMMVDRAIEESGKNSIDVKKYIVRVENGRIEEYDPQDFEGRQCACSK